MNIVPSFIPPPQQAVVPDAPRGTRAVQPEKPALSAAPIPEAASETRRQEEESDAPVVDLASAEQTIAAALEGDFPENASLEIAVNDHQEGFVYRAVDRDTGEVIRQFPAEEVLSRLERLSKVQGLAVDGRV